MGKTVAPAPLDELTEHASRIDQLQADLKAAMRARNAKVIRAVDDGYAQDAVARAIGRKPTAVTKILARAGDLLDELG